MMSRLVTPYALFVAFAALLAIVERIFALTNERRLRREGAREIAPAVFFWMVPVYTLHFVAALVEHAARDSRPPRAWVVAMAALFLASKGLKAWAILHLDGLFTMRVFIPARPIVVQSGPYRLMRHPNYVAVVGEMAALPLLGGAWVTALVFGAAFLAILKARVATEEEALLGLPEYAARMADRRRFLPGRAR
ncbi:MAG TPA: isoprenylcysteine carboxylmethyltransferase family protein [Candidatus Cryosericum sp.]|nr:isoprenylcysteine carboxylmethyltransferase family protein [Candidatus Cryosericum sp.]